jgi:malate dehydrogenase
MARKKISLIGAGNIGGELAALVARRELGDVVLFDIPEKEGPGQGQGPSISSRTAPSSGYDATISGSSSWADVNGSDVVIITAGVPRKPGMSRDDLLSINLKIIRNVGENLKKAAPDAFVIVVSNPLDAMVYELKKRHRLLGQEGRRHGRRARLGALPALPRARVGASVKDVRAMVLGGHGDTMVPVTSNCTINGIPSRSSSPRTSSPRSSTARATAAARSSS